MFKPSENMYGYYTVEKESLLSHVVEDVQWVQMFETSCENASIQQIMLSYAILFWNVFATRGCRP